METTSGLLAVGVVGRRNLKNLQSKISWIQRFRCKAVDCTGIFNNIELVELKFVRAAKIFRFTGLD